MATPPKDITERQQMLLEKIADRVVKYRMAMPAILFLESVRPLNYVGSQAMVFFAPVVHSLFSAREYDEIQEALEHRETISYFIDMLEEKENEAVMREKAEKAARRAAKPKPSLKNMFRRNRGDNV
ncbi:hypothetical protein AMJ86_07850 [bacterium SM23_57]|nr:MAG: hypothetical protein AMJ86_07850 [bacterium SM23_57]